MENTDIKMPLQAKSTPFPVLCWCYKWFGQTCVSLIPGVVVEAGWFSPSMMCWTHAAETKSSPTRCTSKLKAKQKEQMVS